MNISQIVVGYFYKPLIIWAIFFKIITSLTFVPIIFDLVKWILESEIYLVIFIPSFAFSYLQQLIPSYKAIKDIRKARSQNKWITPRVIVDRIGADIALWLSAVVFFASLLMSFGGLDHNAIVNKETYSKLQLVLPLLGFVGLPVISTYYYRDLDKCLKQHGIKLFKKIDSETMIPVISLLFFITLSYVAVRHF